MLYTFGNGRLVQPSLSCGMGTAIVSCYFGAVLRTCVAKKRSVVHELLQRDA